MKRSSVFSAGLGRLPGRAGLLVLLAFAAPFGATLSVSQAGERQAPGALRATLVPVRRCQLASRVAGTVAAFLVEEGGRFRAGQPLVRLRREEGEAADRAAAARVGEARALLVQARAEADSLRELFAREAATRRELRRAEAQIEIGEARLAEAEALQARARLEVEACTLVAPWDGVLLLRRRQPGEGVRSQGELCDLADPSELHAVVQVPVEQIRDFTAGLRAVFLPDQGPEREGVVAQVGGQVEPGSRSIRVKILLDNRDGALWPGAGGAVRLGGR